VFLLKKIISDFLMPLSILLGLFLMGLVMLRTNRTRLTAKKVLTCTFLILVLLSYGALSYWPLQKLENIYPPIEIKSIRPNNIKWIVVLAGSPEETYVRLSEGIFIYRQLPGAKLIVSGGKVVEAALEPSSSKMARIATGLGVNPQDIVQENISRDTKDEARIIKSMIHEKPFILVTSAYHMPRSMALFKAQDMHPIPAPTGYHILPEERYLRPNWFFPNAYNIMDAEIVLHEVLGIISAWAMGQMKVSKQ
jgi:uncharacterized SAM-binding protein YcdF (DUF218 family)